MDYADFSAAKSSKKKLTALSVVLALAIALTLLTKLFLSQSTRNSRFLLNQHPRSLVKSPPPRQKRMATSRRWRIPARFSATSYLTKNLTYPSSVKQRLPTS